MYAQNLFCPRLVGSHDDASTALRPNSITASLRPGFEQKTVADLVAVMEFGHYHRRVSALKQIMEKI